MTRLKDKIVLITGAAQGIGAAIAETFVKEGAFVILSDIKPAGMALSEALGE
ncbi:MAG: SDR family NAD(P)-dependent oxidoreductase, partial [Gammaproteobacteria bacterium]|nr:SDR family NAD(P)-dependent oxidoreductase [Gammaproteobacteria bacterium]